MSPLFFPPPLLPLGRRYCTRSGFWQRMLEEEAQLSQLEAISPVTVTCEARRRMNTGEARMEQPSSGASWSRKVDRGKTRK